ncbi:hypothetical protein [Nocardia xishanensis]|uniref:hypothetical protein n=1 Tax=Nocardia xishanensis TaxID=238964 RepID=UPI00082F650A|nr:hypothetical protein [Nocardia xishanensis]
MNGIPISFAAPRTCPHNWEVVSMVFETQMLDARGRVIVRQPDVQEARVYFICRGCASHTYMTTQWIGCRMYGSEDAKAALAKRMRFWADRIDPAGAPRYMGYSYTIEPGKGVVFHKNGRGCKLWYLGNVDHERAYSESRASTADLADLTDQELLASAMLTPDPDRARACKQEWDRRLRAKWRGAEA